jgi:hypothetical protein
MTHGRSLRVQETSTFWRHPILADLGLISARFVRHCYDLHTHATYVIALITAGCERIRIGRQTVIAPAGTIAVVNPEEWRARRLGIPHVLSINAPARRHRQ